MSPGKEEQIRARAYEIWEKEGRPPGREREHWEQARREIEGDAPPAATAKTAPKRASRSNADGGTTAPAKPRKTQSRAKKQT